MLLVAIERVGTVGWSSVHAWIRERGRRVTVAVVERERRVVHPPVIPLVAVVASKL